MTGSIFPRRLQVEIAFLICVKLLALTLLYQLFFAPAAYERSTDMKTTLTTRLFSAQPGH